jgi:tetratricopeptide (TPR) repeat protein
MPYLTNVTVDEAIEVIVSYHAEYDRAMQQDVALGLLTIAGAFSQPGSEREALLLRVGAQMCGMIRDDVHLETFSAKMRLLASKHDAEALAQFADKPHPVDRYVLARWHDAAGRSWYRIGNHTRAMTEAQAALTLVEQPPDLWWCWADVKSNLLRMRQEADTQVKRAPTVEERDYDEAIATARRLRDNHLDKATLRQKVEHLRGMWNLHHNRMVTRGRDRLGSTLPEFESLKQELITLVGPSELPDPYRQAQTLNQDAELLRRSIDCYRRLSQMPWPRGQWFARQHLPHLMAELDSNEQAESKRQILGLCEEARSAQAGPGGREGFDLDRYYYTVDVARKIVKQDVPALDEHDLGVSRAIQAVAGVAAYKTAAQRYVMPSLQRAAERSFRRADQELDGRERDHRARLACIDEAIALVEEGSARELLDLLSARREPVTTQSPDDVFVPVPGLDVTGDDRSAARGTANLRSRRASSPPGPRQRIIDAVTAQRDREENHWLSNPVPTQGIDPEISHHCRQFSADRFGQAAGPVLIRYFQRAGGQYWAIVFFKGATFGPFPILEKLEKNPILSELLELADSAPKEFHCREIWSVFLEPLLVKLFGDDIDQLERLVIVPCAELFSIPLHVAAVPDGLTGTGRSMPLCHWKPVSFSVSLASHVLRNRAAFRSCLYQNGDELLVLFAGEAGFRQQIAGVLQSTKTWGEQGMTFEPAGAEAIHTLVRHKPEFLVLQCHGEILDNPQAGSVLHLHDGVLSTFGIATRHWLPRNKLTILGACVSGRPVSYADARRTSDGDAGSAAVEIAGFIRGFIAAGCGALLVTNWSVLQSELGTVTQQIIQRIHTSKSVLQLDSLLRDVFTMDRSSTISFDAQIERSVFQLFL